MVPCASLCPCAPSRRGHHASPPALARGWADRGARKARRDAVRERPFAVALRAGSMPSMRAWRLLLACHCWLHADRPFLAQPSPVTGTTPSASAPTRNEIPRRAASAFQIRSGLTCSLASAPAYRRPSGREYATQQPVPVRGLTLVAGSSKHAGLRVGQSFP